MPSLWVTEYDEVFDPNKLGLPPETRVQSVITISGSSTDSAATNANCRTVRLFADAPCAVAFGSAPTADGDSTPLAAEVAEVFHINPGDVIAVISR